MVLGCTCKLFVVSGWWVVVFVLRVVSFGCLASLCLVLGVDEGSLRVLSLTVLFFANCSARRSCLLVMFSLAM